jgi:hypothetical protein
LISREASRDFSSPLQEKFGVKRHSKCLGNQFMKDSQVNLILQVFKVAVSTARSNPISKLQVNSCSNKIILRFQISLQ